MNKNMIEKVQQYFKNKILTGRFQTGKITQHWAEVIIEGYSFYIWIANECNYCEPYDTEKYFMQLPKFTDEEKAIMKPIMKKIVAERAEEIRIARIAQLESELFKLKG